MLQEGSAVVSALREGCALAKVMTEGKSEKRLELRLKVKEGWEVVRLVLPVNASQPYVESARVVESDEAESSMPCVKTDVETLKGIASGRVSAMSAVSRGKLSMTGDRSAAIWAVPVLKAAGNAFFSSEWLVEERLDSLDLSILGLRSGDEVGVVFYEIAVKAKITIEKGETRLIPEWRISKRYSEFRALWQSLKSLEHSVVSKNDDAMCTLHLNLGRHQDPKPAFPPKNASSLETRRQALENWLQFIATKASTPQDLGKLYSFLGLKREIIDAITAIRRAKRATKAGVIKHDSIGGKRRADLVARARSLQSQAERAETRRRGSTLFLWTHIPAWMLLGFLLLRFPRLVGLPLCLFAEPLTVTLPAFGIAVVCGHYTLIQAQSILYRDFFLRMSLLCVRQAIFKQIGLVRAVHVYLTASAVISVYVVAKMIANKRRLEGAARDALFERVHCVAAPLIADRFVALKSIWCKIGQYISARADVMPETWQKALAKLQDDLPADSPNDVDRTLRECNLVDSIEIMSDAIASASIAQVHIGELKKTKAKVAVKVQHRGIAKLMTADIRRALNIAKFCARLDPSSFEPTVTILESWRREIHKELSFLNEVKNSQSARLALDQFADQVVVPEPLVAADRAFGMSFIENAHKIDDIDFLDAYDVDKEALCSRFAHLTSHLIFDVGFMNADPHPGNVLWTPALSEKEQLCLGFLDWGWAHTLSDIERDAWRELVLAMDSMDTKKAVDALKQLGYANNQDDRAPERSVEFFSFLFRSTSASSQAKQETEQFFERRKLQKIEDASNNLREKGGRKMTKVPESFLFVVRVVGAIRGICASLGVTIPLPAIFAMHAAAGKARDTLLSLTTPS